MKPMQLVLIGLAVVCAGGAGLMVMNIMKQEPQVVKVASAPQVKMKKVLIAREEIPMGSELKMDRLEWQNWPEDNIRESFVTQDLKPEAVKEFAAAIARASFFAGEPIREAKIVRSDSGYLSAILPSGRRAVAIRVQAQTSAGGFILPNDHVDVIMTYRDKKGVWITETILENIRVLAIDQDIEEKDGKKTNVGSTATMELTPDQVQIVSVASQISRNRLLLSLRSVEDSGDESGKSASHLLSGKTRKSRGTIRLIRYGKSIEIKPKK